jgi:hypothetical protein
VLHNGEQEIDRELASPADALRVALMMPARRGRLEIGDVLKVVSPNLNGTTHTRATIFRLICQRSPRATLALSVCSIPEWVAGRPVQLARRNRSFRRAPHSRSTLRSISSAPLRARARIRHSLDDIGLRASM